MKAKEYLEQARYLDIIIEAKNQQIEELQSLAEKTTSSAEGDAVKHSTDSSSKLENTVLKIATLRDETRQKLDELIAVKKQIAEVIHEVGDPKLRAILEWRYLCYERWDVIADKLQMEKRWVYSLHGTALERVQVIIDRNSLH